jgi:putative hydrolase of the HAD superfamily
MSQPTLKLFIFDMGGVVSRNTDVFIPVAAHLGLTLERFFELAGEGFARLITGAISGEEFWESFNKRSGLEVKEDLLARFFQPNLEQKVVELVKRLRKRARVVVGTNTIQSHYRIHQERGDYELFDAVYASHLIGLAKPDPAFYSYILEHEGCAAREAVFTDDRTENVRAAALLGIYSFPFTGVLNLKKQIEEPQRSER